MRYKTLLILIYICCFPFLNGQGKKIYRFEKIDQEMLKLVNDARKEQGRRPLEFHPVLNDIALKHSQKMAAENKLSHLFPNYKTLPERLMDPELPFIKSGENVAFSEIADAEYIHDGFMKSTGHRQNILDPDFTHCGIKFVRTKNGFYITEEFVRIYTVLKEEEMEILLEQDAAARYRQAFKSPLVFFAKLKQYARMASVLSARGKKLEPYLNTLPDQWGVIQAINVITPDQEEIKAALAKELTARKYSGTAIGISRIKNLAYPGGAYSVSILLVEGLQGDWSSEKFRQIFLDELNRIRKENGFGSLILDKRFSVEQFPIDGLDASAWEKKYRCQLNGFYNKVDKGKIGVKIFSFNSYDPQEIPGNILDTLGKSSGALDKIGIIVQRAGESAGASVPANYFMVMLIFPEL